MLFEFGNKLFVQKTMFSLCWLQDSIVSRLKW
jgi:hypothetical protein